jgi:toxin HigB-1
MAIRSFADRGTEDIAAGLNTKASRKVLPRRLHTTAQENLVLLDAAASLNDLAVWPSLRLERLKGDRSEQHSIRINSQYRICFEWRSPDAFDVEITDYH